MAGRQSKSDKMLNTVPVEDYEHARTRANNPLAGQAHLDRDQTPVTQLTYDPHLDPQLVWAGKAEHAAVDVPAPSIHVHEDLSAQKIVGSVRKKRFAPSLFDVTELDAAQAVEFYQHERSWSNRMILGDSLVVMNSLLERERMAGQVQCVYMDPPYGIKYQSNFQPTISSKNVVDGRDSDVTREPEMIQAYRDTWELGVHSYLTYLRDRFTTSRDLLNDSGSIFVQISEANQHLVRILLDEVFGAQNFVSLISYVTTSGFAQVKTLGRSGDYVIWFAKDISKLKTRTLLARNEVKAGHTWIELLDGSRRKMTKEELDGLTSIPDGARVFQLGDATSQDPASENQDFEFNGVTYNPGKNRHWSAVFPSGMEALARANRLVPVGNTLRYVRYADDFPFQAMTNLWTDTGIAGFASDKRYVVQTSSKVIERCLLMSTDPGDLVVDPTCGSGTTAAVAEKFGRRWITIDTSRVALSIARERILTSVFPYYVLRDPSRGVDGGLLYEEVTRTTLGTIANGAEPEVIPLVDEPRVEKKKVRVSGPFTFEALSRYSVNPSDGLQKEIRTDQDASNHVEILLAALNRQGIPRPNGKPLKISSLAAVSAAGAIQAEGLVDVDGESTRFAVSIGPRFGAVTMSQISEALQQSIGYGLIVITGFAVASDAQAKLASGKVGATPVSLLLANPDLLAGDLLKNTSGSQTFRLFASPDVTVTKVEKDFVVQVEGVDSYDASTGEIVSFGRSGIQAWFLDDNYDGLVFRVSQAFFPVTDSWSRLEKALRGTVDAELVDRFHSWTSLPFESGDKKKIAVRVVTNDGNAAEIIVALNDVKASKAGSK